MQDVDPDIDGVKLAPDDFGGNLHEPQGLIVRRRLDVEAVFSAQGADDDGGQGSINFSSSSDSRQVRTASVGGVDRP